MELKTTRAYGEHIFVSKERHVSPLAGFPCLRKLRLVKGCFYKHGMDMWQF